MSANGTPARERLRRDFDRAMARSADLFERVLSGVEPPPASDEFPVYELARIVEEGQASFENEEFRFLIQQGVRLEYDGDARLRSRFVRQLRHPESRLGDEARRILPHLIGAIEDVDFPLNRIGAVVRYYTNQLFRRLEETEPPAPSDNLVDVIERWRGEQTSRDSIITALGHAGVTAVPIVSELLFEATGDAGLVSAAIDALTRCSSPETAATGQATSYSGARALAYAVSEPFLDEAEEARACRALASTWPAAHTYILYNLRKHSHEDIPFRWMELLVAQGELRAVDRILEEVLMHSSDPDYREDLRAGLDLIERSQDPGREGKILRLLEGPQVPPEVVMLLEDWVATSPNAGFLEGFRSEGRQRFDFVHLGEDFSAFATRLADSSLDSVCTRWNAAYHESLGWLRRSDLPRSAFEVDHETAIENAMIERLGFRRRPDEGSLRERVESLRDETLGRQPDGQVPLTEIYRTRPKGNVWLTDIYLRDINRLYIRAAQSFDTGDLARAREELSIVLAIEPEYPFAVMLEEVMGL